ncbi:MAG: hypothetical protein ACI8PZ_006033 [Myxococcota bacterium]|jgi:hypothetical protein
MWLLLGVLGCGSGAEPEPEPAPTARTKSVPRAKTKAKAKDRGATPPAPFVVVKPAERDARWASARCNDGTPFSMDVRDQGSDTWVVQLAGGFFCDDGVVPCSERKQKLTTTLPVSDGASRPLKVAGLFSRSDDVNPDFHGANHVRMNYCSSDLWLGDDTERTPTSGAPEGWFFAGRHNVHAGLEALVTLGLDDATDRVLLVGYSAGGAGVVGNLDHVIETLPAMTAAGRLKVLLDGSWIPTWDATGMPDADRWGPVHRACDAAVRARGEDPVRCVFGPEWWPHVEATGVPVLVQISGLDATQLPAFGIDTDAEQEAWRANAAKTLEGLPWVFSLGRRYHVVSLSDEFHRIGPEKQQYRDLVHDFWTGGAPRRVVVGYDRPVPDGP